MIYRTHNCGELRASNIGKTVKLAGWANNQRNFGKMTFLTIRDHYGEMQLFFSPDSSLLKLVNSLKPESIIFIEGKAHSRGDRANTEMKTGEIGIICNKLTIDSIVEKLPFTLNEKLPNEELRLKYRFLDLRIL